MCFNWRGYVIVVEGRELERHVKKGVVTKHIYHIKNISTTILIQMTESARNVDS